MMMAPTILDTTENWKYIDSYAIKKGTLHHQPHSLCFQFGISTLPPHLLLCNSTRPCMTLDPQHQAWTNDQLGMAWMNGHNHGSGNGMSPIFVLVSGFILKWFSTTPWLWEKGLIYKILVGKSWLVESLGWLKFMIGWKSCLVEIHDWLVDFKCEFQNFEMKR